MTEHKYAALRLRPGAHVLDVVHGESHTSGELAALAGESGRVERIDATTSSAASLPFGDEVFDAVHCERVFQYANDAHAVISELYRVIKHGAAAMIVDPDWETIVVAGSDPELARTVVRAFNELVPNPHAGRYHRKLLTHCGFREVDVTGEAVSLPYPAAVKLVLDPAVMHAVKTHAVSAHDGARFLADLQMAEERRAFYFAYCVFAGTGTK